MLGARANAVVAVVLAATAATLAGTAFGAGCTSFSADAVAADATDARSDAAIDATLKSDAAAVPDAGPPCTDTDLVFIGGSDPNLPGRSPDDLAPHVRDAHFYVATQGGTARCAWLYVLTPPRAGSVVIGVYGDKSSAPYALLARATLTAPVTSGWNHAPLDKPLAITRGSALWLAIGPDQSSMQVNSVLDAGCNPRVFSAMVSAGETLSNPFVSAMRFDNCSVAAYLGP